MATTVSAELLEQAIALSKVGQQQEARELLVQVITADVHNETAWLWYADSFPTGADHIKALEECLHHNPDCQAARKGLTTPRDRQSSSSSEMSELGSSGTQPSPKPVLFSADTPTTSGAAKKIRTGPYVLVILVVAIGVIWIIARPGVFTIQPIGALPEGVTIVYYSRNPKMPVFSSPDGLCLEIQGSVTLLCRAAALNALGELSERILLRLPYSRWAYLLSTGGREFDG